MPRATSSKGKASSAKAKSPATLNRVIQREILRLAADQGIEPRKLEEFAYFVVEKQKEKDPKPLTLTQLKKVVFDHFGVKNLTELKKSGSFQMATSGIDHLNLSKKEGWEIIHRKLIGILPDEENDVGYGCINGINVFKYDLPWRVFGLDPKTATTDDIKSAYYKLSSIYHPDKGGDPEIFNRLNVFYKSLTEKF